MKGKAVISRGVHKNVFQALSSSKFAEKILTQVIGECLGVENPLKRPAEFYIQEPDWAIQAKLNFHGVEFRLTGSTRNGRTPAQFHNALMKLHELVKDTIAEALLGTDKVQLFVVIMLDADIETKPGSGVYSNVIESDAEWVSN